MRGIKRQDFPDTIGGRIKKLMYEKRMTQGYLADMVFYNRRAICDMVNDHQRIPADTLGSIARILGVSCDYLIYGEEANHDNSKST